MTITEALPIVISITSLGIAGASLYLTQFRRPRIVARVGPDVHLYHPRDGGTALYLPILFTNESPTRGAVLQVFLELEAPDGKHHFLKWLEEADIEHRTWNYSHKFRAKPFTVDGYSTVDKVFWFLCPEGPETFVFEGGTYVFRTHIWTESTPKPNAIGEAQLNVPEEVASLLKARKEQNDPQSRFLYFEGKMLVAQSSTREIPPWIDKDLAP